MGETGTVVSPALPQAQSWIWAALPASTDSVAVVRDPDLAAVLRHSGLRVTEPGWRQAIKDPGLDAVVVRLRPDWALRAAFTAIRRRALKPRLILIAGGGRPRPMERPVRWRRALELLGSFAAGNLLGLSLSMLAARLRLHGRNTELFCLTDRTRSSYRISSHPLRERVVPAGWVLVESGSRPAPAATQAALTEAKSRLESDLCPQSTTVVETGKLLTFADSDRGRYVIRLAGGESRRFLATGLTTVKRLRADDHQGAVASRVVEPLAVGEIGRLTYSVESIAGGVHVEHFTDALWQDCIGFLAALRNLDSSPARQRPCLTSIRQAAETIIPMCESRHAAQLVQLGTELDRNFANLRPGWEHGDFWPENLLVEQDRLTTVLDWETALPNSLPALDLFDLMALAGQGSAGLAPGERFIRSTWPLITGPPDWRLLAYCEATGTAQDPDHLRDLACAYLILRLARELQDVPDRRHLRRWQAENIAAPLDLLAAQKSSPANPDSTRR